MYERTGYFRVSRVATDLDTDMRSGLEQMEGKLSSKIVNLFKGFGQLEQIIIEKYFLPYLGFSIKR